MLKVATVCTGIGSPEMALRNLDIDHEIVFGCEIDKYARQTYLANFNPNTMYHDMTAEKWDKPEQYSDIFIGGIPCQSFSLAGKRMGENDPRGVLFYDFYRYVKNQRPKAFIIENVKGLLSADNGKIFQNWLQLLGDTVNGHHQMFNHPDSLGYNLHWTVLNTKDFGLPQNRERVFLVGIRSDIHYGFRFPVGRRLDKRLKDVLETFEDGRFSTRDEFDVYMEKYFLSDKIIQGFLNRKKEWSGQFKPKNEYDIGNCITQRCHKMGVDDNYIVVKEATKQGFAIAKDGDSINLSHPESKTRRGRVGDQIANTLETSCNQGVIQLNPSKESGGKQPYQQSMVYDKKGLSPALMRNRSDLNIRNGCRIRKLTPLETFRLQGFPDSFVRPVSDTQLYRQAGNTISVPVIQGILKNLIDVI